MAIEMIVFDLDGTIVSYPNSEYGSAWDALGRAVGLEDKFKANMKKFLPQKTDYESWVRADVGLLKGLSHELAKKQLFPPPYTSGVREFFAATKGRFIKGIVSGSIGFVAEYIRNELELDFYIANELGVADGTFNGLYKINVDMWAPPDKAWHVRELQKQYKLPKEKVMFVGDHNNDVRAAAEVGIFVGFNPKTEAVRKAANYIITDLRELLYILKK